MKRILITLISLTTIFMASSAFALSGGNTGGGDGDSFTITPTAANVPGAGAFTFQPSPSSTVAFLTDATDGSAYSITAYSKKNLGKEAGMQYLAVSSETGMYQTSLGVSATTLSDPGSTLAGFSQKE